MKKPIKNTENRSFCSEKEEIRDIQKGTKNEKWNKQEKYIQIFEKTRFRDTSKIQDDEFEYIFNRIEFMYLQIDVWCVQCKDWSHKTTLEEVKKRKERVYNWLLDERIRRIFFRGNYKPKIRV